MFKKISDYFEGKKTYIAAFCTFVVGGLLYVGVIDTKTAEVIGLILSSLGITLARGAATPNA
jgi:hypothetical protein